VQVKVVGNALGHDGGIYVIGIRIDLINKALPVPQKEVLNIAKATVLNNDHEFAFKKYRYFDIIIYIISYYHSDLDIMIYEYLNFSELTFCNVFSDGSQERDHKHRCNNIQCLVCV